MINNLKKHFPIILTLILFCLFLLPENFVLATYNDLIAPGDSVTIGEFVYDDDMQPTTTDCTVSIFSPNVAAPLLVIWHI